MTRRPPSHFLVASLILLALILFLAPQEVREKSSLSLRESLKPGLLAVYYGKEFWPKKKRSRSTSKLVQLQEQLAKLQKEMRVERAIRLRLQEQATRQQQYAEFPFRGKSSAALVIPELVTARVLSPSLQQAWKHQQILDAGHQNRIAESHWVLQTTRPVVDLGKDYLVQPEDFVLAGKVVLGRIFRVGKWSSILQNVTDDTFSARARLIRKVDQQYISGAEGLLKGTGKKQCQLTLINNAEIVSVGDEVYTVSEESPQGYPLFFGTVIKAELVPDSLEWKIEVEPAANQVETSQVEILRQRVNPRRMLTNQKPLPGWPASDDSLKTASAKGKK